MGDGGGHQEPVAGLDAPVPADLADQGVDRVMAVQNTFGSSGGARGVEDHPHRIGVQHGPVDRLATGQRLEARLPGRRRTAHHHDLRGRGHVRGHAGQHRGVVMAAEVGGHEDHPHVGVGQDEAQFVVAQRRQDGVDHHAGQRRGVVDDGGLVPVGQHEGHHAADRDARQHRGGQCGRAIVQGAAVQPGRPVDEDLTVGVRAGGLTQRVRECVGDPQPAGVGLSGPPGIRWHRAQHSALHPSHRHRMAKPGRRMGVHGDLGDLRIRRGVRPLHLQRGGAGRDLERGGQFG